MLGRAVQQQHLQQPKPPKQKKQKEVQDTPAKPWRPLNEQEVLDGVRQAWKTEHVVYTQCSAYALALAFCIFGKYM